MALSIDACVARPFPIRALVVDDEAAASGLRRLLRQHDDVQVLGDAVNGDAALAAIRELRPNVVFFDTETAGLDRLGIVSMLDARERPLIVFVAAHEEDAVSAFAVRATDYLLKPVSEERLAASVDRVRDELRLRAHGRLYLELRDLLDGASDDARFTRGANGAGDQKREGVRYAARIAVRVGHRSVLVPVEDVDWIEADGTCSNLHVGDRCLVIRETLDALEARLNPSAFLRIHRSSLVNLSRVVELRHPPQSSLTIVLRGGTELTVSRRRRETVLESIGRSR